jgi:hypothetical protein
MSATASGRRRLGLGLVCLLGITGLAGPAPAQTRPQVRDLGAEAPRSAIYIGNSFFYYNNSMHGHVNSMIRLAPPPAHAGFATSSVTISGSGLNWHDVGSYFRPDALRSYAFDRDNNIVFNRSGAKLYDIAIMMDCSQCPIHPELSALFTEYARRHSETVRSHGAQPVFFMSWAYADKPEMAQLLAEAYTAAGNANDALVIPAGLAFARAIAERPALNLYVADKRHPSLAGTYLAAATTYAALFGRTPEGNRHLAGLDADTAAFLQRVAWATVRDYYGSQRAAN